MGKSKIIGAAACLVVVGALGSLYLTVYGLPVRIDPRPHAALGEALATEALKQGGAGTRVALITRDTSIYLNPAIDAQVRRFQEALTKGGGQISLTHRIKVDPLRSTAVPPGDFLQILKKVGDNDVVVSFLGPPTLSQEQWASLKGKAPKVLALCAPHLLREIDLKKLFAQGLLRAVVINKSAVPGTAPAADNSQAWFDHLFMWITPTTVGELAEPSAAHP
jgi:hypothetical protein